MLKQQQQFMSKQPTFSDISANGIEKSDNLDFDPTDYYDSYDDGYGQHLPKTHANFKEYSRNLIYY